jgi:hypothetical protein
MNYTDNKQVLKVFYDRNGLSAIFDKDNVYLERAFSDIDRIWLENFDKIGTINFLMIAEAPLWGQAKKYIYNLDINNSQFFYRSDLGDILHRHISDKRDFVKVCNEIGLIVTDISPFPFNSRDTAINYRGLITLQYRQLVSLTIPTFFEKKIKAINEKKSKEIKTFFDMLE